MADMIAKSTNPDKKQTDYIRNNVEDFYDNIAERKNKIKQTDLVIKKARQVVAKQIRDKNLENKAKNSVLQLHRWDLIREKKSEATTHALEVKKESLKLRQWAKFVLVYDVLRQAWLGFFSYRQTKNLRLLMLISAMKMMRSLKLRVKRHGTHFELRFDR